MYHIEIVLEEQHYRLLQSQAEQRGKELRELLRDIVEAHIRAHARTDDPLGTLVGMADGEPGLVAREHDKHLYGEPS